MADHVEHVSVAVRDDFIARQTRASPVAALAELIWNSLDADASNVRIEFAHNDLAGGMSKIHVYDDGDGFSRDEAKALFGNLGGSWKRRHRATRRNGRAIHGQKGAVDIRPSRSGNLWSGTFAMLLPMEIARFASCFWTLT
jgi:Histidine kinase-, DNA gyrase B-, and HSP90-like ATPase